MGQFNLFMKMVSEEYKLSERQQELMSQRLLADDKEFEKVWRFYNNKSSRTLDGVDEFKFMLQDLLN